MRTKSGDGHANHSTENVLNWSVGLIKPFPKDQADLDSHCFFQNLTLLMVHIGSQGTV